MDINVSTLFAALEGIRNRVEGLGYARAEAEVTFASTESSYRSEVSVDISTRVFESEQSEYKFFKGGWVDCEKLVTEAEAYVMAMPTLAEHKRKQRVTQSEEFESGLLSAAADEEDAVIEQALLAQAAQVSHDRKQLLGLWYKQGYHITSTS